MKTADKLDLSVIDIRGFKETPYAGHPASFSATIPEILIKKHTVEGDIVFDPFNGSGTTAIKACTMDRRGIGTDVNPRFLEMSQNRWKEINKQLLVPYQYSPQFILDDARTLEQIPDDSVDFVVSSPPYQDTVTYSKTTERIARDLGNLSRERYLEGMERVIESTGRKLKKGKSCYWLMYDITVDGIFYPVGADITEICFKSKTLKLEKVHLILLMALSYYSYAIRCTKR
ncbi:MAG: DNA methyltransferase [Candidatus Methanoperedens sp.]|nr:DNA methyltransferase [Candidatus Methanoperedens sp.]